MIITDFDVVRIAIDKSEADAPLVVDGDGMLSLPVGFQCVQAIAGRHHCTSPPNFAHERKKIVVRIAEERHPQFVVG